MATSPITSKSVSSSIDNLIKKASEKREVSASLDSKTGSLESGITKEGDNSLFAAGGKQLGKQDFLNLLVTQLKHQDPLSPSENTEFVAQLAQFSSLEGTQNISESVDNLNANLATMVEKQKESAATMAEASAVNLVGKRARMKLEEVKWDPAKGEPVKFTVHAPPGKDVLVALTNSKDEAINYVEVKGGGDKELVWSGNNFDGSSAAAGTYGISVVTKDDLGTEVGYAFLVDRVTGISYTAEGPKLEIAGQEVPFDQVAGLVDEDRKSEEQP